MLWKLEQIVKHGNRHRRLDNISLEITAGITALLGYSGAGKSSLLNILVGFESTDSGRCSCGIDKAGYNLDFFWVPQNYGLWPDCTANEHLKMVDNTIEDKKVQLILDSLDISHKKDSRPVEMSQGECARLSVARALASNAAVLVMDEPLSHVDPSRKGRYWRFLTDYVKTNDMSLVFSSHVPENVIADAENVICLKAGKMIYDGTVSELYHKPESKELAECLGETNWFDGDDAKIWFKDINAPVSIRPEQLILKEAAESKFIVENIYFQGAITEVELKHVPTSEKRTFFCRLCQNKIKIKGNVSIEVC